MTRCTPSSPYSAAKAGGDLQVFAAVRTYGVDALLTRGSNTYGPYQYPEKMIPLFTTNLLDGQPVPVYGDGKQARDFIWAEDHCAGIELALEKGVAGEAYNVGGGNEIANIETTERLLELTGRDALADHARRRTGSATTAATRSTRASCGRSAGSRRRRSPRASSSTVAWYRDNRDWWEPIKRGETLRGLQRAPVRRQGVTRCPS